MHIRILIASPYNFATTDIKYLIVCHGVDCRYMLYVEDVLFERKKPI